MRRAPLRARARRRIRHSDMILVISYDLAPRTIGLPDFVELLKQQGEWSHYIRSTWLIDTPKSPKELYEALSPAIVPGDNIIITTLGTYWGHLSADAWKWIDARKGSAADVKAG
jgi:hypothetical protein